jgi:hypothetical protein
VTLYFIFDLCELATGFEAELLAHLAWDQRGGRTGLSVHGGQVGLPSCAFDMAARRSHR